MAKKSFVLYDVSIQDVDDMTPDECKLFLTSLRNYRRGDGIPQIQDRFMRSKIMFAIESMAENEEKYTRKCERLYENKRIHREKVQEASAKTHEEVAVQVQQPSIVEEKKPSAQRFTKPTIDDILIYFSEKGYPSTEAHKFFNYYESNGWKVGKNPMKKWHSAVANWMSNAQEKTSHGYNNTKYERQIAAEQQLGAALAARSAEEFAAESLTSNSAEGGFVPPPL